MSSEIESAESRAYIIYFRRRLQRWRDAGFADELAIRLATANAKTQHPLSEEQQRAVNEFLRDELNRR